MRRGLVLRGQEQPVKRYNYEQSPTPPPSLSKSPVVLAYIYIHISSTNINHIIHDIFLKKRFSHLKQADRITDDMTLHNIKKTRLRLLRLRVLRRRRQ